MISFESNGSFKNLEKFLNSVSKGHIFRKLEGYAQEGVNALAAATPVDTSEASNSWGFEVEVGKGSASIMWTNTSMTDDGQAPVVILLQYGHGTGTGGYVQGRDFINPAMKPVFDKIADKMWKAVTSA